MAKIAQWFQKINRSKKPLIIPVHLAIIMDGNGRWANKRGLPRTAGHQAGMERIRDVIKVCLEMGVQYLTLYTFSTENWYRPAEEVNFLMNLFEKAFQTELEKIHQQNIKVRFIGVKHNLSPHLIDLMEKSEQLTVNNKALTLNIALNYGGRSELISATKGIVRAIQKNELQLESLNEQTLADHLFTAGQPDPDLFIRPGGEYRISNFLLWQLAYTELYFSERYWPDFDRNEIIKAFQYYSQRERRFGRVKGEKQDG